MSDQPKQPLTGLAKQCNLLLLALSFFSRLPISHWVVYSKDNLNQANRYFGLVGWILGLLVCAGYVLFSQWFTQPVSVFLAMVLSIMLTGLFHEDGLADMADGFGGGFERQRKLEIMKDSRLGSYGSAALIMALLGKWLLLSQISDVTTAILLAYPLSRVVSGSFIFDARYVADEDGSKSKPLAEQQSGTELAILLLTGAASLLLLPFNLAIGVVLVLVLFRRWFKRLMIKHIGGYTGDCLGGAQQLAELLIYLSLLAAQGNTHGPLL